MLYLCLVTILATSTAAYVPNCPLGEQVINLSRKLGTASLSSLDKLVNVVSNPPPTQGVVLKLSHNNITTLPLDFFSDEIFRLVVRLDLSSNQLDIITPGLFDKLRCLKMLDISHNSLASISSDVLRNLSNLKILNLENNSLRELPSDLFMSLNSLSVINLSHNNITKIGLRTFHEDLTGLTQVDLSYNQLSAYEPWPYIPKTPWTNRLTFNFQHNEIDRFTNQMGWIKERNYTDSLTVNLQFNKLKYFRIAMFSQYMKTQKTLTAYDIGDFALHVTENPWFCDCGMYYGVKLVNTSFYAIFAKNYLSCQGPSELKGLQLGHFFDHPDLLICNITDKCPSGCKCVDRPHRGHIEVDCSTSGEYLSLPTEVPAGNLFLQMSGNKLRALQERDYIGNVSILNVSNNLIEEIDNSFIELATNLSSVDVSKNKLKTLPSKLQNIPFGSVIFTENPLECSCHTLWLNDWVRRNSDNLSYELTARLICSVDEREHRLVDVTWISLACYRDVAIGVSIALAFLLVLIIVTTVILLKYRYEFKVWMYHYLQVHPFDHAPCDQADDATKLYDVYLSIDRENDDIRIWVKNRLLRRLETKTRSRAPYKVYYPCRQDDFSDSIADQMVENINRSRRVLAVVNDSYLKSGWSIEEFDHAHRLMEEARSGRLLVLVYGDLDLSNVTQEPLNSYLTQKQCLHMSDKRMWQKLRYELPHQPITNVTSASRESLTSGISSINATLSECSDLSSFQMDDNDFVTTGVV